MKWSIGTTSYAKLQKFLAQPPINSHMAISGKNPAVSTTTAAKVNKIVLLCYQLTRISNFGVFPRPPKSPKTYPWVLVL